MALAFGMTPGEGAAPHWRWSNPIPHGNNILDLAVRDGVVWQLGDRGQIYTSANLDDWEAHDTGITQALRGMTFQGDQVFISTASGRILHGSGPDDLTVLNLRTTDWLEGIAASPEAIVAVGDNGAIYRSGDGVNWDRQPGHDTWFRSVAHGDGVFVVVGEDGMILSSESGLEWRERVSSTGNHLNRVDFINDRFWVVGDEGTVLTNNLEMRFLPVSPGITNDLFAVAGNSEEVIVAGDQAVYRRDLATGAWSPQADPANPLHAPSWPYYSALWDGRLFLLGGRTGLMVEGYHTNSGSSLFWSESPQPTRSWLWSVMRAPGFYAAAGDLGTIVTSYDGVAWEREVVPASALDEVLLGIGGNTNVLVAVGTAGTILNSPNLLTNVLGTNDVGELLTNTVSLMGVLWHESAPAPSPNDLQGITASDDLLVAVGANGTILTSENGSNWVSRASPVTTYLSSVTAWPGGFVAAGDFGTILTSENGVNWDQRSSGVTNWVYSVRHAEGKLVAVGEAGLILTSEDGRSWVRRESGTTIWLNDAVFDGQWYVAGSNGYVLTSPDAITWTIAPTQTPRSLYGLASAQGQIVAVGLEGVILRQQLAPISSSVDFLGYEHAAGVSLFLFQGTPDQRFRLEGAEEVGGPWEQIEELEIGNADGTLLYEHHAPEKNAVFYRTRTVAD